MMVLRRFDFGNHVVAFELFLPEKLKELKEYTRLQEESLVSGKQRFDTWISEKAASMPPDERGDFYEWNSDTHFQLTEVFPRIFRYSFLTYLISFHDEELKRMAWFLSGKKSHINIQMGNRPNIANIIKFYTKDLQVTYPKTSAVARKMQQYRLLRNVIVHDGGVMPTDHGDFKDEKQFEEFKSFVAQHEHITLERSGISECIVLGATPFWSAVIDTMESFFEELIAAMKASHRKN